METEEIISRIRDVVPDAQIQVDGADCDFSAVVVSESFQGLMTVKRQQKILVQFSDVLGSGALHALSIKALTPEELKKKQEQSLTQLTL